MHPALSVIVFTTATGAGYGMLVLFALAAAGGFVPASSGIGYVGLGLALALVTGGLLASTRHLGHPQRAWRALSQWRSSWLSREGVAALATYPPALWLAFGWVLDERVPVIPALLTAVGAFATVVCTGMIYASLKPVRRWRHPLTVPVYLAMSMATGAVALVAILRGFAVSGAVGELAALLTLALAWTLKWVWWRQTDAATGGPTIETATGLGRFGKVRLLEPPHTGSSWLLDEMGYRIARKHSVKLRRIATGAGLLAPAALIVLTVGWPPIWLGTLAATAAFLTTLMGTAVERWLFFAEARHTQALYYGHDLA